MHNIRPGASGAFIISQSEADVNVKLARKEGRSPQGYSPADECWENFPPRHRPPLRSPQGYPLADKRLSQTGVSTAPIARHHASEKVTLHNSCACGSISGFLGAGRKPGESSLSCRECRRFIEYRPIEKLKRRHKRKPFTDCLEILGDSGIQDDEAIFILSKINQ